MNEEVYWDPEYEMYYTYNAEEDVVTYLEDYHAIPLEQELEEGGGEGGGGEEEVKAAVVEEVLIDKVRERVEEIPRNFERRKTLTFEDQLKEGVDRYRTKRLTMKGTLKIEEAEIQELKLKELAKQYAKQLSDGNTEKNEDKEKRKSVRLQTRDFKDPKFAQQMAALLDNGKE